jgi:DNA repair protein RadC
MKRIEQLYEGDRPREKLLRRGVEVLKDHELMAVILGSGIAGKDVLKLSREAVNAVKEDIDSLSLDKLLTIEGLGKAKASQILAAIELGRRFLTAGSVRILGAGDVWDLLRGYAARKQEHFFALTLDGASRLIEERLITVGTLNQSLVHPREVFADAIADRAAGIIIAHNHPSGTLSPSRADMQITDRLKEVAKLVGIELLDHVILAKEGYYSFSDEGLL